MDLHRHKKIALSLGRRNPSCDSTTNSFSKCLQGQRKDICSMTIFLYHVLHNISFSTNHLHYRYSSHAYSFSQM